MKNKKTAVQDFQGMKKTVLLDFDGVLHSYKSGWKGARNIPDPPVPGMLEWLQAFLWAHCDPPECICAMAPAMDWEVCIYSSRSRQFGGRIAMRRWMIKHGFDIDWLQMIKFPVKKPAAFITIDDRAICFDGSPGMIDTLTERIMSFKPWHKGGFSLMSHPFKMPGEDTRYITIFPDGTAWCAVYDDFINLQQSTAGYGKTPEIAVSQLIRGKL